MNLLATLVFFAFVALTVGSAMVVVFHSRIIYSAFALLFTLVGVASMYVYLGADFMAAAQVMVYVGGILILIIFGVFMTTRISSLEIPQITHQRYLALIPVGLLAVGLGWLIWTTPWASNPAPAGPTSAELGRLLLTDYLAPFEMASVLLLAALIGSMRMARLFRGMDNE